MNRLFGLALTHLSAFIWFHLHNYFIRITLCLKFLRLKKTEHNFLWEKILIVCRTVQTFHKVFFEKLIIAKIKNLRFPRQWLGTEKETSEMLHLEYSFIWCWKLDASGSRSETPGKFWTLVLEKDGEDQLDRSCEIWRSVTRVKEQRNIVHEISKRKGNCIGHILRINCLLWQVVEGTIKGGIELKGGRGRRGRRRRKLLNDIKERKWYSHMKEEAVDHTIWRTRFGRGFGPVVRQTTKWMNDAV
jgi:hypothetical protein